MNTYNPIQENLLFDVSTVALNVENEVNEKFLSGEISQSEYDELIKQIRHWMNATKMIVSLHKEVKQWKYILEKLYTTKDINNE